MSEWCFIQQPLDALTDNQCLKQLLESSLIDHLGTFWDLNHTLALTGIKFEWLKHWEACILYWSSIYRATLIKLIASHYVLTLSHDATFFLFPQKNDTWINKRKQQYLENVRHWKVPEFVFNQCNNVYLLNSILSSFHFSLTHNMNLKVRNKFYFYKIK